MCCPTSLSSYCCSYPYFFQAVDDSGVPGLDRVDSLAECLVELRNNPSLALTNQQVRNIQLFLLSLFDLSYVFALACFFLTFSVLYALLYLGEQYCCCLAEPAGLRQEESRVFAQTQEQAGYWEVQVPQEEAGVHSRGGECEEARTHHHCPTCPVARLFSSDWEYFCQALCHPPESKEEGDWHSVQMGPHPGGLQENQAVHSGQCNSDAADQPAAGGSELHHFSSVAQQAGEKTGQRGCDAGAGTAKPLLCGCWPSAPCQCAPPICTPPTRPGSPVPPAQ